MKILKVLVACCVSALAASSVFSSDYSPEFLQAMTKGAKARIPLKVIDDDGISVSSVKVRVRMGMNFEERSYWIDGVTDENGLFLVEGVTTGNKIAISLSKDGYYNSNRELHFIRMGSEHAVKDGKWQPWGKEEQIVLRKIRNPIELIRYDIVLQVPATNAWIGFDMRKGGFVAPYGNGVMSDFKINVDWDGVVKPQSKHCEMDISFPGEENGFYFERKTLESEYANVMAASPLKSYDKSSLIWMERKDGVYLREKSVWNGYDAVARLRSVTDEQGKLISAHYANIRKMEVSPSKRGCPLLSLSYVFNPTPNDTNLESKR